MTPEIIRAVSVTADILEDGITGEQAFRVSATLDNGRLWGAVLQMPVLLAADFDVRAATTGDPK